MVSLLEAAGIPTSIQEFDFMYSPYALERDPIFVCWGLKWNLLEIWPKLKKWR